MNFADHSSAQKSGEDAGIHLIVIHLGLGDNAGLEGVGQDDVFWREVGFEEFVEPCPVHSGFENLTATGVALEKIHEELCGAMVDAPLLEDEVSGIDRAKNTVSLMEIDSDKGWTVVGWNSWFHRPTILQHPFYQLPEPDPTAERVRIKPSCRLTPFPSSHTEDSAKNVNVWNRLFSTLEIYIKLCLMLKQMKFCVCEHRGSHQRGRYHLQ